VVGNASAGDGWDKMREAAHATVGTDQGNASVIGYSANQPELRTKAGPFLQSRLIKPADSYSAIQCFFKRSFVIIHL